MATTSAGVIQTSGVINVGGVGTSTFANGINLTGGCITLASGSCIGGGGSGTINSGTTNRLAYYTGGTTLDSANFLTVDATNLRLGLATSTPATTLSVAGNTYLDSNVITYSSSTASTLTFSYQKSATSTIPQLVNAWSIGTTTAVGNPPILSIDGANGRVGIGTAGPGKLLEVNGESVFFNNITFDGSRMSGAPGIFGNDAETICLGANSQTTQLCLSWSANKVGFGTGSPNAQVDVLSSNPQILFTDSSSGEADLLVSVTGNLAELRNNAGSAGSLLNLDLDDARVGIGTSTPLSTLSVYGSTTIQSFVNTNNAFRIQNAATSTVFSVNTIATGVGIGTSTKLSTLTVQGRDNVTTTGTASSSATFNEITCSGACSLTTQVGIGDQVRIGQGGEVRTVTAINSDTVLVVDRNFTNSTTSVTMTTLPSIFRLDDASSTPRILVNNYGAFGISTSSPGAGLAIATSTYITAGLGVGRSTTTTGVIETTGVINVQGAGTSSFTNGINLADGCFSTRGTCAALGGTTINSGTANRLAYYSGASTLDSANFLTVDATNLRLGLATVTPATTFSVAGNTYLDSNVITFASSSAASLTLAFQKSATTTIPSDIFNAFSFATSTNVSPILSIGSSASGIPRVGIGTGTPAALFSIRNIWADNTLYIEDEANDTTPFVIDASGNVGIGSSTPSDKLTIYRGGFTQTLSTWPQPVVSQPLPVKGFLLDTTNIGNGEDIYVSGKYAYVTSTNNDRLTVIDVSDPVYPRVTGSVQDTTNLNGASEVFVQGKYAYVTANVLGGLAVVDISNPSSPRLVSSIADSALASAFGLYVSGKYAYVTATNRVTIVDISNPSSPVIVGSVVDSTRLALSRSIFVSGKYAYATGFTNDYLSVIDISNPASPVIIGSVTAASMDGAQSVYVSGRYAYVVAYMVEGMAVVDISSPSNPQVVGSVSSSTYFDDPWEIYVSGKYAYVAGYFDTTIVDISSSTAPFAVAESNSSSPDLDAARGIFVSGRYVYVVTTDGYLGIYDSLGIDSPGGNIGDLFASSIEVSDDVSIGNNLFVQSGLSVGPSGLYSQGPGTFSTFATTSLSSIPSLSASITDSNSSSVVDVLTVSHMASSSASNGIGSGLLFMNESGSGDATSTARISSILTSVSGTT